MKKLLAFFPLLLLCSCGVETFTITETASMVGYHRTVQPREQSYTFSDAKHLKFTEEFTQPVLSYVIYSGTDSVGFDPKAWVLKGSNNGKRWTAVDTQEDQSFCARYQENIYTVANPGMYKYYMFDFSANDGDVISFSDIRFFYEDIRAPWLNFPYPEINFRIDSPDTEGAAIYQRMVQDPDAYIRYHAQKVARILYFSDQDSIMNVERIRYNIHDYDGISAKSGGNGRVRIDYSTRWIEHAAKQSLYRFDEETRGVLYHELTHAYQYEPHGIGNYGNNRVNWACIEGIADAVRAEAGLFDMSSRRPGGHWLDGYRTTGFFLQWLTTKDPDALRKFHRSVALLDPWSFDGAIKYVFGDEASIEGMWDEYQTFLKN